MNNGGIDPANLAILTGLVTTVCKGITLAFTLTNGQKFLLYLGMAIFIVGAWAISNGPIEANWTIGLVSAVIMITAASGGFSIGVDKVTSGKTTAKGDTYDGGGNS